MDGILVNTDLRRFLAYLQYERLRPRGDQNPFAARPHASASMSATEGDTQFISFSDGDIILLSSDDAQFRVDLIVLKRASPVFESMAALTKIEDGTLAARPKTLRMEETSEVLDVLLRLIYPTTVAPRITSNAVLHAVDKLQITSHVVHHTIDAYLATIEPPLRAWALAVRYHCGLGRENAVKRFIEGKDVDLTLDIPELDGISARLLTRLLEIKKNCVAAANLLLGSTSSQSAYRLSCRSHTGAKWLIDHKALISTFPFNLTFQSEDTLQFMLTHGQDPCYNCTYEFSSTESYALVRKRADIRKELADLLQSAATNEGKMT